MNFLVQCAERLGVEKIRDAQVQAVRQLFQRNDAQVMRLAVQKIIDCGLRNRRQLAHAVNRYVPLPAQRNKPGPYHLRNPHLCSPFRFLPHYHSRAKKLWEYG